MELWRDVLRGRWSLLVAGILLEAVVMIPFGGSFRHVAAVPRALGVMVAVLAALLGGPFVGAGVALAGWSIFFPFVANGGSLSLFALPIWTATAVVAGAAADRLERLEPRERC